MNEQKETTHVVRPFCHTLSVLGWEVENIHGNRFTKGLPDARIFHPKHGKKDPKYAPKWVEFKHIKSLYHERINISLTDAQKQVFPKMLDSGEQVYIIASRCLSGSTEEKMKLRMRWYNYILNNPPNAHYALDSRFWHHLDFDNL